MRCEINLGLPEACEPTSLDGHMKLDPETSLNTHYTHCGEKKQRVGVRKENRQ